MLNVLYRISDNSRKVDNNREKHKIRNAGKIDSLKNVIQHFGVENLFVFADNCDDLTIKKIELLGVHPQILSLGNSASLRYVINYAIENFSDTDFVYFIEDDYWHLPNSKAILLEGLGIADYVTLYDNPDKFTNFYDRGFNPYIFDKGEQCQVFLTKNSHWKTTNSTTMTFATKVFVLRKDISVFRKFTAQKIPNDFGIFLILTKQPLLPLLFKLRSIRLFLAAFVSLLFFKKKRILISSIPGFSTHLELDYLSPLIDWQATIDNPSSNLYKIKP